MIHKEFRSFLASQDEAKRQPYLLTFWGGMPWAKYRRRHASFEAAQAEAHRVLALLEYGARAAHPAIIDGPDLGNNGRTIP